MAPHSKTNLEIPSLGTTDWTCSTHYPVRRTSPPFSSGPGLVPAQQLPLDSPLIPRWVTQPARPVQISIPPASLLVQLLMRLSLDLAPGV